MSKNRITFPFTNNTYVLGSDMIAKGYKGLFGELWYNLRDVLTTPETCGYTLRAIREEEAFIAHKRTFNQTRGENGQS